MHASDFQPLGVISKGCLAEGGFGDDALDVAVFRFTLGIPGFDDDLIPRVVGVLGAALLVGNHVLAGSSPGGAQVIIKLSACAAAYTCSNLAAT